MKLNKKFLWITISALLTITGPVILYLVFPQETRFSIGTVSFSYKGLISIAIVFFAVWLVMKKLKGETDFKSLSHLVLYGTLPVIIGEPIYQIIKQIYNGRIIQDINFLMAFIQSLLTIITAIIIAVLIAYYYKTHKIGRAIGIGLVLWIALGWIIKLTGYGT